MASDVSALVDKVRKLLALAGSPNIHEAAAAAKRAQILIEEHRLEALLHPQEDDEEAVTDGRDAPLEESRRLRRWKVLLASALGENNGCVAYTTRRAGMTSLLLAGRDVDRAAVLAMWSWLIARIEWASATEGAGRDRGWHQGFRVGAAEVVAARLAEAGQETRAALSSTALVRVEPALAARAAAVDDFVSEKLRLKPGRRLMVNAEAYQRGREVGAVLSLEPDES